MKHFKEWLHKLMAENAARKMKAKAEYLNQRSEEDLQAMEFGGRLYISHNGVPVVCADELKSDIPSTLAKSRAAWVDFNGKGGRREQTA